MEGYFLGESLDVNEQITSVLDVTTFVIGVVGISGLYGDGKFHGGEVVFSDKVLVYTRNVCAAINQCSGIDDFHGVQGNDQLNGDLH